MPEVTDEAKPSPRWRKYGLGGVMAAVGTAWSYMERADVLDGALAFLTRLKPFLLANWDLLVMGIGLSLIVHEFGRTRGWWGLAEKAEAVAPAEEPIPDPIPEPTPPPEPIASQDSAERLLDLFRHWDEAFTYAAAVLRTEICNYRAFSPEGSLLAFALREYPLQSCLEAIVTLRRQFEVYAPQNTPQSSFNKLKADLLGTFKECNYQLVDWLNKGGYVLRGDELFSSKMYETFYLSYERALEAAARHRFHSEIGVIAKQLATMETKPQKPAGPASSTASGPDQQP